jgi:pimeloyl-ACP methyl ester carboxylesterase
LTGAHERTARLDGLRIHVSDVGDGPPVLLMNGLGAHTDMWGPLEQALQGFRLISFDAPGAGRSATPLLPVSVRRVARLAALVLDTVGVEQADVLGYSMGGIVAQQLAADAPDRVRRLVLAGTTCGLGAIPGGPRAVLHLLVPVRYLSPRLYASTIGGMVGGRARHDTQWVANLAALRLRYVSLRGYLGQMLSMAYWTGLPLLSRIPHPTLVVTGDDDPLSPLANAMLLARTLPQGRMLLAPGEGHLLFADAGSPVLEPIREFLAAESLDEARVWREGVLVTDEDFHAAIPPAWFQAQPWGAIGVLLRRRWLTAANPQPTESARRHAT